MAKGIKLIPWIAIQLLFVVCMQIHKVAALEESQCAGNNITLQCNSPDWLIQILYEEYGDFNQSEHSDVCQLTECPSTEFISPDSVALCNGQSSCTFEVPSDVQLTACTKNATVLKVVYSCIPKSTNFNMCGDIYFPNAESLYLHSPGYPATRLGPVNCTCHVTGQNMTVTTLDQTKVRFSNVILILATSNGTKNINDLSVLNRVEFTGVNDVEVILDNDFSNETFKLWIGVKGTGMTLICGHPVIPSYVSTTTLLLPSSPAFTPGTVTPTFTATHALGHTSEFTSVSQSDNPSSSQTIQTSDTVRYDQSSLFSQSVTEGSSNETTNQQNKSPNDQSDWILIVALSATFAVLFVIVIIITVVLMCRRLDSKNVSRTADDRSEPSTIYAFDNVNVETEANTVHF